MADKIQDFEVNSPRWLSLEDFEGELWKNIPNYEGFYQVSNYGRFKANDRYVDNPRGKSRHLKSKIISLWKKKDGYYTILLYSHGSRQAFPAHRIVAAVFVPNTQNLPIINHKDENPSNNCFWNLEWCDHTYNMNYGTANIRKSQHLTNRKDISLRVFQFDFNGKFIQSYPSANEAQRQTGIKANHILDVCRNGRSTSAGGYIWSFENSESSFESINKRIQKNSFQYKEKKVLQLSLDGKLIAKYASIKEACEKTGIKRYSISACCRHVGYYKTGGGYRWEYEE